MPVSSMCVNIAISKEILTVDDQAWRERLNEDSKAREEEIQRIRERGKYPARG